MKKLLFAFLFLFLGTFASQAQNDYFYYYHGEKVPLTLDKSYVNVFTNVGFDAKLIRELGFKDFEFVIDNSSKNRQQFAKLQFTSALSDAEYYEKVAALRAVSGVKHVAPFFKREGAEPIGTSNYFYIKLNNEGDYTTLEKTAIAHDATIVKQIPHMPLWYILKVDADNDRASVTAANRFYETGGFAEIDPAFMFNFRNSCTNDTDFGSLWGLSNSSNPSIDINACQAWSITEGNGINVAILDQGIHKTHNDLAANIHPSSFDCNSGSSPSVFSGGSHGTHVAGTVAAVKDNNLQVVGVAPQSELMSVSHTLGLTPNVSAELASGINWAWQNGADVINNSWGDQGGLYYSQLQSAALENAIINAMTLGRNGSGTLVVFAAGNQSPAMDYPGTFHDDIVTVGAITSTGSRSGFSGYGTKLDVVAPGSNILSTIPYNGTTPYDGTSMASPHVTGTIALILSVNSCLTAAEVRNILESTSQKVGGYSYSTTAGRPNGTWNNQMGYGLIDAYAAVLAAQSASGYSMDLYMQDTPADVGNEPNIISPIMWTSQDIWVRVFNDGGTVHQNPDYSSVGTPNHVYVKVRNRGCLPSNGSEELNVYWSKAGTSLQWPAHWNGSTFPTGELKGDLIGTVTLPPLLPGQEAIVSVPWVVPNPADYASITPGDQWHFCLLARVVTPNDPMTFAETTDLNGNVTNNNNIVWKNVTVVDSPINSVVGPVGGIVAVENIHDAPHRFILEFGTFEEDGVPVHELAEVTVHMNEVLYEAWQAGGQEAQLIEPLEDGTVKVVGNFARLYLKLQPEQTGILDLKFDFPAKKQVEETKHVFNIIQRDGETEKIIGGETYIINRAAVDDNQNPENSSHITAMGPNPATDELVVKYHLFEANDAYLAIYGIYGTNADVYYYDLDLGGSDILINVSDYPNGYYAVVLMVNGEAVDSKNLLKE
ncbi:S8 family serine peptidase [Flavobacterium salilacus subsp. salilacus]|uniref:S8 family serine peptidase n=1 Tax=Flavobacterium TaxID=237 RepID=UPI0013C30FED|nr:MULTISPECIES: S8 family serine peptidase [Flavobacterium]KAF2514130.1 S8 family serine peptidase [Flavobacterium salilacus subsp. salilacus]MBE1615212.1 S8 family serine peptidase [Flavobacterium sp. SaA2.13]